MLPSFIPPPLLPQGSRAPAGTQGQAGARRQGRRDGTAVGAPQDSHSEWGGGVSPPYTVAL